MPPQASRRLRSACDNCHRMKIRCYGNNPCENCMSTSNLCVYSYTFKLGRPQGAKNKQQARTEKNNRSTSSQPIEDVLKDGNFLETESTTQTNISQQQEKQRASPARMTDLSIVGDSDGFDSAAILDAMMRAESNASLQDPNEWVHTLQHYTSPVSAPLTPSCSMQSNQMDMMDTVDFNDFSNDNSLFSESLGFSLTQTSPFITGRNLGQAQNTAPQRSSEEISKYPTPLPVQNTAHCCCFAQISELLCSLKAKAGCEGSSVHNIDNVLYSVENAFKSWQCLSQCHICAQNSDSEGVLLALMSVRILLVRIYHARADQVSRHTPKGHGQSGTSLHQESDGRHEGSNNNKPQVLIGGFEVMGNDRVLLLEVLIRATARKTQAAVQKFTEMLENKRRMIDYRMSSDPSNDRGCLRQGIGARVEYTNAEIDLTHAQQIAHRTLRLVHILVQPLCNE